MTTNEMSTARICLRPPATVLNRLIAWVSRRRYGTVLEPLLATGHNRKVAMGYAMMESSVSGWKALDPTLKTLAVMASAHRIGCSWCTDYGYWAAVQDGLDETTLRAVPTWRDSQLFTPTQRQVMEFAELASGEVAEVPEELVDALRSELGEAALVELAMMVAMENLRSRFNASLGLTSQGFKARCEL